MYHVPVDSNTEGVTAIVVRGRKDKEPAPGTYFETLHAGVQAWTAYLLKQAEAKGYLPYNTSANAFYDEAAWYERWSPMSYEANQHQDLHLYAKKTGKLTRVMRISVYRLPSGRYEVTAYVG